MADAWHLPGWTGPVTGWHTGFRFSGAAFRTPSLDTPTARSIAEYVRESALGARRMYDLGEVLRAIDGVARRLEGGADAGDEAVRLMREGLGWPEGLARETLAEARRCWTLHAMRALLDEELEDARILDGFVGDRPAVAAESPGAGDGPGSGIVRRRRASGPPLLLNVLASNVPGVGITAIIRGLLVRSGVLCRSAGGEPFLPALFARLLAEEHPDLGRTVAVTWWPAGSAAPEWEAWSRVADSAVVYGGAEAVSSVRAGLPPNVEVLAYGPRVGIGVVLPPADRDPEAARLLARDVCAYEQQGCVSPRLVFVIGEDPAAFSRLLADALEQETRRQPPPELAEAEAIGIRGLRAEREFEASAGRGLLASEPDLRWTILLDPEPRLETTALPRVVRLSAVGSVGDLLTALAPLRGHIQAVGYAGDAGLEDLADAAATLGACRVAPLGRMAWPPVDWRHDGRFQLLPLLRWTDWEQGTQ